MASAGIRRLVFAAPFVITSCRPTAAKRESREVPIAIPATPDAQVHLRKLVTELEPLGPETNPIDCRIARCNPPPPGTKPEPPRPVTTMIRVVRAMKREPTGTRVRFDRADSRMTESWRAVFVDRYGEELPDGECTIIAKSWSEMECTTRLAPEQLVATSEEHKLRLIPPRELVEQVEEKRGAMTTVKARIVGLAIVGNVTQLTIPVGTARGITVAHEVILDGHPCTIVRVTERTTICNVDLTPDQVKSGRGTVRLVAPK